MINFLKKYIKNRSSNILSDKYKTDNKIHKIIKKTKNISEVYIKNNLSLFLIIFVCLLNYDKTFKLFKIPYLLTNKLIFNLDNINEYVEDM